MQLAVPANYDSEIVPELAKYPVREVYGKLPGDFVGGGRPSYMGTPISFRNLGRYVAVLQKHGIAFNYLLNSSCHGNREWTRSWQKRLMRLMDRLSEIGIRKLGVALQEVDEFAVDFVYHQINMLKSEPFVKQYL